VFFNTIDFSVEKLHRTYTEYMKLPAWERRMLQAYLEIKSKKDEDRFIALQNEVKH